MKKEQSEKIKPQVFLLERMNDWWDGPTRHIYANAGVCYLCCELMTEPPKEKELTFSDVICDGCKKAGFWSEGKP